MTVGRITRYLLLFFSIALATTVGAVCRDTPCYYEEFDPFVVPWVAPLERNFEEVFKRYRYFSVRNLDDGHLEVSEHIRGEPVSVTRYRLDKSAALIEVDKQSRVAGSVVSLWEDEGALVVYDAGTLEEVRRIPMRKPSGKYNVYNKITRSEGTSH